MHVLDQNRRWILLGAALTFFPPIFFFLGTILWAAITYNGICPGLIDIFPYPCTIWEFIGRNTVSPFAMAAQFGICVTWVGFVTMISIFGFTLRWQIKFICSID